MPDDVRFELALQALLDGRRLDDRPAGTDPPAAAVEPLLVLDAVARAHRLVLFGREDDAGAAPIRRWGHLEVGEELGRGASGTVHRAWDTRLAREVALKLLAHDTAANDAEVLEEGRLLARLRHPHIVTVFGSDTYDGVAGIWMELVGGDTLDDVLERDGLFGAEEALIVGTDVAGALSAVHAAGLLHRDVKARNVIRERGGRLVLMDLGAGRRADEAPASGDGTGTPLYMAPEVLAGGSATERSDVYSLGVLLYRLLTGTFPVTAAGVADLREAHCASRRVPLRVQRPDLPATVADVVERAADPDPARRFAGAAECERAIRDALRDVLDQRAAVASVARRAWVRWRRRLAPVAAAAGLLAAAASMAWDTTPGRAGRRLVGAPVPPRSPVYLAVDGSLVIANGRRVTVVPGNPALAMALAVSTDYGIRTMTGTPPWLGGAAFTLDGAPAPAAPTASGTCCFADGTTDGRFNYAVRQDSTLLEPIGSRPLAPAALVRFSRDWTHPEQLFTLTADGRPEAAGAYLGIAYSGRSDSFWVTRNDGASASIEQWSRDGRRLAVPVKVSGPLTGLGVDPRDDTLWVWRSDPNSRAIHLDNFHPDGRYLGTFDLGAPTPFLDGTGLEFAWPGR